MEVPAHLSPARVVTHVDRSRRRQLAWDSPLRTRVACSARGVIARTEGAHATRFRLGHERAEARAVPQAMVLADSAAEGVDVLDVRPRTSACTH